MECSIPTNVRTIYIYIITGKIERGARLGGAYVEVEGLGAPIGLKVKVTGLKWREKSFYST